MKDFKEWLSDYLRYFLLILAAVLAIALVVIGVRVYQGMTNPTMGDGDRIEIGAEQETTVSETEAVTETEPQTGSAKEPQMESEKEQQTRFETEPSETELQMESETAPVSGTDTAGSETAGNEAGTDGGSVSAAGDADAAAIAEPESEVLIVVETEPETEAVYEPVYKTLKGSCYIRSGPSMEADIIGEYMYGTTVEFLEDVGGWYKVRIDGMVGYMGARFF